MPVYDFDSPVVDSSHYDAGAEINAILRDHDNVRVAGDWLWVRSTIQLAPYKKIYCTNPSTLLKAFNGPMVVVKAGGFQIIADLAFEGQAAEGRTGPNIVVEAGGGWQKFDGIRTARSADAGVEMKQPHAGHASSFINCELSALNGKPGVQLPVTEPKNGGLRRFEFCKGGGNLLVDWAGSNAGMMIGCDTYSFLISEESNYGIFVSNRFAIANPELSILGMNHRFSCNLTSSQVRLANSSIWYDGSNYDGGTTRPWLRMLTKSTKANLDPLFMEATIEAAKEERRENARRWGLMKKKIHDPQDPYPRPKP
jgi:hypothetical protein